MNSDNRFGYFTISLDFELFWGVLESKTIPTYVENLTGTPMAVRRLLSMFEKYGVHATWATVGMLYFENENALNQNLPSLMPSYDNPSLDPYRFLSSSTNRSPEFLFAPDLINEISTYKNQEISTHTFSHYYCLENGQNAQQFEADLKKAVATAESFKFDTKTIVFPRNQINSKYLTVAAENGIKAYRGNESHWAYATSSASSYNSKFKKAIRLLDSYLNLTGHHVHSIPSSDNDNPVELKASRFLRPYSSKLRFFEKLRLSRILRSMDKAAKSGKVFHLWWHPHNFGKNTDENFFFLEQILLHYQKHKANGTLRPATMAELSEL